MLAFGVGPTQPLGDQPQPLELFQKLRVKEGFGFPLLCFGRDSKFLSVYGPVILGPLPFVILSEAKDLSPTLVQNTAYLRLETHELSVL
jgi:hypothetical protein